MPRRSMTGTERMLRWDSTDAEEEILQTLALHGPLNKTEISKKTGLHYVSVHEAIKYFEIVQSVYVVRIEKSKKNVPMKIYSLSVYGLLHTLFYAYYDSEAMMLSIRPKSPTKDKSYFVREILKLDTVAEKNKDVFPLVFGKWSFFKKKKVLDQAKKRLYSAVFSTLVGFSPIQIGRAREKFLMESLLLNFYGPSRNEFSHDSRYIQGEISNKETESQAQALDEWLEAVCAEPELRKLTETFCKLRENELWDKMHFYQEEIKQYHSHLDRACTPV